MKLQHEFIPATTARSVGDGVFFRPIKSWHSGTYAGEGKEFIPGSNDRSGCILQDRVRGVLVACLVPKTVTHRLYWHEREPNKVVSVFLSYPDAMGCSGRDYFWEALGIEGDDISRYVGDNAEEEMEAAVRKYFLEGMGE